MSRIPSLRRRKPRGLRAKLPGRRRPTMLDGIKNAVRAHR